MQGGRPKTEAQSEDMGQGWGAKTTRRKLKECVTKKRPGLLPAFDGGWIFG